MNPIKEFEDAVSLLRHCRSQLQPIQELYNASLKNQQVGTDLQIKVKEFLEHIRSALDYSMHGLLERLQIVPINPRLIYFPYAELEQGKEDFRKKRVLQEVPLHPYIVSTLESFQHFIDPGNSWLPKLCDLCNKNKHRAFTPQVLGEGQQLAAPASRRGVIERIRTRSSLRHQEPP